MDATGVYVVGYTGGTLPGQTSVGNYDAFVRKYDVNGNELWTRQFGTASHDFAYGVTAVATGVYVVGYTSGTLPGQTSVGDVFVRKYNVDGNELWTRQFGTGLSDTGRAVAADATGVYVSGSTGSRLPGQTSFGGAFLRKYDGNGTELWTRVFGSGRSESFESASGVAVDTTGVYVTGNISIGSDRVVFVQKYDANGNELWVRNVGSGGHGIQATGVTTDGSGVYVAGDSAGSLLKQTCGGPFGGAFSPRSLLSVPLNKACAIPRPNSTLSPVCLTSLIGIPIAFWAGMSMVAITVLSGWFLK